MKEQFWIFLAQGSSPGDGWGANQYGIPEEIRGGAIAIVSFDPTLMVDSNVMEAKICLSAANEDLRGRVSSFGLLRPIWQRER